MPLLLHPKVAAASTTDAGIYRYIISVINSSSLPGFYASVFAFVLLMTQAFLLNYLMNEYRMVSRQTYLPAMSYLLVTSLLPEWNFLSAPLVATTLVVVCFIYLFHLYNLANTKGKIYNMGLMIGICSYIYFPSAAFILCLLLGILILKPFRFNELILLLLGTMTPYYFHAAYLFLTDSFSFQNFVPAIDVDVPRIKSSIYLAVSTFLLAVPFLVGGFFVQSHLHRMLIQIRKNWSILLLYLLLAFFIPFLNTDNSFSNWILLAPPFAAFHTACYFYLTRNFVALALFFSTTGYIIFQQYATSLWL